MNYVRIILVLSTLVLGEASAKKAKTAALSKDNATMTCSEVRKLYGDGPRKGMMCEVREALDATTGLVFCFYEDSEKSSYSFCRIEKIDYQYLNSEYSADFE